MYYAYLNASSPLHVAFPTGVVPLSRPRPCPCRLGDDKAPIEDCYMIAIRRCTADQQEKMAHLMAMAGQGTIEEAREFMVENLEIPLRQFHVSNVEIPLRAVL